MLNNQLKKTSLKSSVTIVALAGAALSLSACQTTPTSPVMQRENSTYETIGLGKTKIIAQENALASAKKTCGLRQPIVITNNVQYNGVFNESTGRVVEQATTIVGAVLGKRAPDLSRDDDYEYTITFRCQ